MPIALAIDTCLDACQVALADGKALNDSDALQVTRGHAEHLFPLIENLLQRNQLAYGDLTHIAVTRGPGGFASIRTGIAAAKGLALSLQIPAIGLTLFEALALGLPCKTALMVHDARRGMCCYQLFSNGLPQSKPLLGPWEQLVDDIHQRKFPAFEQLVGPAATLLVEKVGKEFTEVGEAFADPILLAQYALAQKITHDLQPFYMRDADAKPSRQKPPDILNLSAV